MLDVYLHDVRVGTLEPRGRGIRFTHAPEALEDDTVSALSLALPKQLESFTDSEAGPFFRNLLPEQAYRRLVAAAAGAALAVMFVTLQSTTAVRLSTSVLILAGIIVLLPAVFRVFAVQVAPYAPKSEFAFLLMLAVLCAFATRRLGVYYLVGAFVVGISAQRFRERLPAMASEQMLHAVEVFASFFVPFYFFSAGLHLRAEDFALDALLVGAGFLGVMVPLRIALVALHRRLVLKEKIRQGVRIGVAMLPTLVFTLVIAEILRDTFTVPRPIFGGLLIYTLANTLVPGFALRLPAPEIDLWHAPEPEPVSPPETSC